MKDYGVTSINNFSEVLLRIFLNNENKNKVDWWRKYHLFVSLY